MTPLLLWAGLGAIIIPLAIIGLRSDDILYTLFTRTVSAVTTGTHYAAVEIDWAAGEWRDWPALVADLQGRVGHVPVSPPGLPMFYGLLNGALDGLPDSALEPLQRPLMPYQCNNYTYLDYSPAQWASAWLGILMPVWAALAVFPLYRVARRMIGDGARLVVVWFPLIPALVVFAPTWYMIYPLLSLLAFWLFDIALTENRRGWLALAGILTGVFIFINYAFLPLPALFGFYIWARLFLIERPQKPDTPLIRPIILGLWFGAGLILPWLVYWFVSGQTFFDLLFASLNLHLDLERPYLPWLWLHPWDWVLWLGLPILLLWLAGLWHWRRTREGTPPVLGIALALTILALTLSNAGRGETGRVWIVFTPFAMIAAVDGLKRIHPHPKSLSHQGRGTLHATPPLNPLPVNREGTYTTREAAVRRTRQATSLQNPPDEATPLSPGGRGAGGEGAEALITLAQALLMIVPAVTLAAIDAPDMKPAPAPPGGIEVAQPINAAFADQFTLTGWDATADDEVITLRLNWQARQQMTIPYWFSALLVDPAGAPVAEADVWQPLQTNYPTTCWSPNELIGESVMLTLPPDASSGDWWVSFSAFADETAADRLPITAPDGTTDQQIGLGPISVP